MGGLEAPEESLWRVALESRIVECVRVQAKRPFHCPYESTLGNHAAGVDWSDFIWFRPEPVIPVVRVISEKSRLFHTRLIENRILTSIDDERQRYLRSLLQKTEDSSFYASSEPLAPVAVSVEIRNDLCLFSVGATESPVRRAYECFNDTGEVV